MAEYILDTNHISPLVTYGHPLRDKILTHIQAGDVFALPTPVLHEFLFGITLLPRARKNLQEWQRLKGLFKYYRVDESVAEEAAELRVRLRRRGRQLEAIDSFIAIIALKNDLPLLTTDKDFQEIPRLQHKNWRK